MNGLSPYHLINGVIRPTLKITDLWSSSAEILIIGTGIEESNLRYLYQKGKGIDNNPYNDGLGKGLYQMETATHDDIWTNYLMFQPNLAVRVRRFMALPQKEKPDANQLIWNLAYATLLCRMHYLRVPEPLPKESDLEGIARYWKKHYNTEKGKGSEEKFILDYKMWMK